MKINDSLWIEDTAEDEVGAFKAASRLRELFDHGTCGKCKGTNTAIGCRLDSEGNDWLEMVCQDFKNCGAKLQYGQGKKDKGTIYPKTRWDNLSPTQKKNRADEEAYANEHAGFLPNGGWFIYKKS
jgi:hypothetical protein